MLRRRRYRKAERGEVTCSECRHYVPGRFGSRGRCQKVSHRGRAEAAELEHVRRECGSRDLRQRGG